MASGSLVAGDLFCMRRNCWLTLAALRISRVSPRSSNKNTLDFAMAQRRAGVRFDLHIYEKGGHGLGLGGPPLEPAKCHDWTRDCSSWLKVEGFARKS